MYVADGGRRSLRRLRRGAIEVVADKEKGSHAHRLQRSSKASEAVSSLSHTQNLKIVQV